MVVLVAAHLSVCPIETRVMLYIHIYIHVACCGVRASAHLFAHTSLPCLCLLHAHMWLAAPVSVSPIYSSPVGAVGAEGRGAVCVMSAGLWLFT